MAVMEMYCNENVTDGWWPKLLHPESITAFMPKATLPTDCSSPVSEYERKEVKQATSCKVARIF